MSGITVEFDDREIYNDIRSQIDITVTEPGEGTWDYVLMDDTAVKMVSEELHIGESSTYTLYTRGGGRYAESWSNPYASVNGLIEDANGQPVTKIEGTIISSTTTSVTIRITATGFPVTGGDPPLTVDWVQCSYQYKKYEKSYSNPTTNTETLSIRETDATSIALYGRRVMNLTWPMGQSEEETRSLVLSYLARYKDPVPRIKMTVQGKTDALIVQIFTRKISDLITVVNTELGLNADFYINTLDVYHDPFGLLTADWTLEYQRTNETYTFFTLDTSELDGTHILAY
jgi:hypothetical protein